MNIFDNLLESSAKVADKVAKVTSECIDKGKDKINELSLENDLSKAQKQLGALVYALHKSGQSNDELVKQYIEDIEKIEKQLEEARKEQPETVDTEAEAEETCFCHNCGAAISTADSFCRNCGNSVK